MNKVTICDANFLLSVDKFSEDFAGCAITLLVDFFLGYNQVKLVAMFRDLTAFMTPLRVLQMIQLPIGATNSVAQFVKIVTKILQDHIPEVARQFVDDVGVKGPKTTYNNAEVAPNIQRYVLKHI